MGSAFSHALPKDLFLGLCRSVGDVLDVLLFFSSADVLDVLLSFFQSGRCGSLGTAFSHALKSGRCGSLGTAFSHALPTHLFLGFCLVFSGFQKQRFGIFLAAVSHGLDVLLSFSMVRFVGDVSRVFLATVLHGLSTKPAWVLLFRMRSPKTFFLGFAVPSVTFLVGSKSNVSAFFWLRLTWFRRFAIFQYSAFRR